jgi:hypothetical protein
MFSAVYRQIKRFLAWLNGGGRSGSVKDAVKEAENHRRDVESRYGGGGNGYG